MHSQKKVTGQTFSPTPTGPAINLEQKEENLAVAWQQLSGTYVDIPWLECAERSKASHTSHACRHSEGSGQAARQSSEKIRQMSSSP